MKKKERHEKESSFHFLIFSFSPEPLDLKGFCAQGAGAGTSEK